MGVKVRERNGAWWLYIDHAGHRKAKKIGRGKGAKALAEAASVKIQARLLDGDLGVFSAAEPAAAVPTFSEVFQEWRERYPALNAIAASTMENYVSFGTQHLLPSLGHLPITAISMEVIEGFIESKRAPGGSVRRKGKALADSSLKTGLQVLRLVLRRAVRRKLVTANPMNEVEWRSSPRVDQVDPFAPRELRAILTAADRLEPDFGTMLRLWMGSGGRAGEIAALQWGDLDMAAGSARIQRTWTRKRLGPTKTRQDRTVSFLHPVSDDTPEWRPGPTVASREVLRGLRGLATRSLEPSGFVFLRKGLPWSSRDMHRAWKRVLLAAGVRYRMPEQLRHTFASTMLSRNAPLLYVQTAGGWRSATVLLRVYSRWLPQASATPAQPAGSVASGGSPGHAG